MQHACHVLSAPIAICADANALDAGIPPILGTKSLSAAVPTQQSPMPKQQRLIEAVAESHGDIYVSAGILSCYSGLPIQLTLHGTPLRPQSTFAAQAWGFAGLALQQTKTLFPISVVCLHLVHLHLHIWRWEQTAHGRHAACTDSTDKTFAVP